jgi:glycyl-tRNA synthetase beta chain
VKFLLEIGLEELPARFILPASKQLAELMEEMLAEARIGFSGFDVYSSPRRLALKINDIAERQEDLAQEVKGPPKNIAYKDGQPTKALEGFARSQGVGVDDLFVKTLGNAEYLFANKFVKGLPTKEVLAEMLPKVITGLSFSCIIMVASSTVVSGVTVMTVVVITSATVILSAK